MKNMKKMISIGLIAAMTLSLVACSGRGESTDSSTSGNDTIVADANTKVPGTDTIKIGLSVQAMDTNTTAWESGISAVISQYDNIEYQIFDAQASAETQTSQFEDMINQGYDAIIVNPVDSAALANVTEEAEAAGTNVIALSISPDAVCTAVVGSSMYNHGALVAEDAAERLNGTGRAVCICAPVALQAMCPGDQGFMDKLEEYDGMEFLEAQPGDWTTETANTLMRDFLTKYDNDIDVVYCLNDQMAIGCAQAIEAAGLTGKILVYGDEGSDDGKQYVKDGKLTGTVDGDSPSIGMVAAEIAISCASTGASAANLSETPKIYLPFNMVSSDNVE